MSRHRDVRKLTYDDYYDEYEEDRCVRVCVCISACVCLSVYPFECVSI